MFLIGYISNYGNALEELSLEWFFEAKIYMESASSKVTHETSDK